MTKKYNKNITDELWRRGSLEWKLHAGQKSLYDLFHNTKTKKHVWLMARRFGKSHSLVILALEQCLKQPNSIVKIASPTRDQVEKNLRPLFRDILEDCPEELKPEWRKADGIYFFKNGSEIQLAGTDKGHGEKLRGGNSHIAMVDEAGSCSDLTNLINNILLPTTLKTGGKIILASTPPTEMDHEFLHFIEDAENRGTLIKKTIYDNPLLSEETIKEAIEEVGGLESPSCRREYFCVDENTLIKTESGYKKITEVQLGEKVFTHKGRYRPVVNTWKNPLGDRDVYKVQSSNNMSDVCTEGHQLYIAKSNYKNLENGYEEGWLKVEDIDLNHPTKRVYFKVPIDKTEVTSKFDPEFLYLCGWHIAEGHFGDTCQVLSLNYNDDFETINELTKKYWGKEYKVYHSTDNYFQAQLNHSGARDFYKKFDVGAKEKRIPSEFKNLPEQHLIKLIQGLFLGDGSCNFETKHVTYSSISLSLICDISDILHKLDIPHQICKNREEGPSEILGREVYVQNCYQIKLFGKNFDTYVEKIFNTVPNEKSNRSRNVIKDGHVFTRIIDISKIEYNKEFVYDLEVEEDHSYVGLHSVFHNCEIVKDSKRTVLPEVTTQLLKDIVKEHVKPPHYYSYEAMDIGFNDFTVVLFGYHDFREDKVIIEDEIVMTSKDLHLSKLADQIWAKEEELWKIPQTGEVRRPYLRVSDTNLVAINEIKQHSCNRVNFIATDKDDNNTAINNLRMMLAAKKIIIHPRCTVLINHLMNVKWAANKKEFARFTGTDGLTHHYDAVDAIKYFIRNVVYSKNPYPHTYNIEFKDLFLTGAKSQHQDRNLSIYQKIFGRK